MFVETIIVFREQINRALIMMAGKAEDRAFISIKHQANPSLLPSQSAAGSIYVYFYVFIMSLPPAVKETGFCSLPFRNALILMIS